MRSASPSMSWSGRVANGVWRRAVERRRCRTSPGDGPAARSLPRLRRRRRRLRAAAPVGRAVDASLTCPRDVSRRRPLGERRREVGERAEGDASSASSSPPPLPRRAVERGGRAELRLHRQQQSLQRTRRGVSRRAGGAFPQRAGLDGRATAILLAGRLTGAVSWTCPAHVAGTHLASPPPRLRHAAALRGPHPRAARRRLYQLRDEGGA